jgi:beta-phosphoglucomutase family hydrolase
MLKAFIFDMDGVIIDSEPIHFEIDMETARHLGFELTSEDLEKYVGMRNPDMWALIKQEYGLSQSVEDIVGFQLAQKLTLLDELQIEPIEGIRALLQDLRSHGIKIGLASSSPRVFIEKVLVKFGIRDFFTSVVSGEEVPEGKPAPDIYLEAAKSLGVMPEECVVLEDARSGVRAAKSAGMRCIGFANPGSGNQDLSAADRIVKSIGEIRVRELFGAE